MHLHTVDAPVPLRCAGLHASNPRPERDAFLAATALVHGLTLVSQNVADFQGSGIFFVNPWEHRMESNVEQAGC